MELVWHYREHIRIQQPNHVGRFAHHAIGVKTRAGTLNAIFAVADMTPGVV